jgi:hypothetical protein
MANRSQTGGKLVVKSALVQWWAKPLRNCLGLWALLTLVATLLSTNALAQSLETHAFDFQCAASFGQKLDTTHPATSLSLEPKVSYRFAPQWVVKFYTLIDRPTDRYDDFSIPTADASVEFSTTLADSVRAGVFFQASAVDVLRWNIDGWIGRLAVGPSLAWQATGWLRLELSAAPFVQLSQYESRADGEAFSVIGFAQLIKATVQWGRWRAEGSVFFIQSRQRLWRNEYLVSQQLAFATSPQLSVGISHQIADQLVSLSTGLARPFGLFDSRMSRLSGFVRWQI